VERGRVTKCPTTQPHSPHKPLKPPRCYLHTTKTPKTPRSPMPHLYSPSLIPYLPSPLLRSLHRDLCKIRGSAWGSKCPGANYVRYAPWTTLLGYHAQVLKEFKVRKFRFAKGWADPYYRGRNTAPWEQDEVSPTLLTSPYPEHTPEYYAHSLNRALERINRPQGTAKGAKAPTWSQDDILRLHSAPKQPC